jgi:alpha-N-arabinofuranosidase
MRNQITLFAAILFFISYNWKVCAQNSVTFQESNGTIINKNIYGHFAEHLGRCIYDGIYVGEGNTSIPNTAGVRNDVVKALKELNIPNLRWPGGCFADTYHWKDGIGPKDKRPSIVNRWWGGVTENNSFGTHDFLNLCELLGTEPYLAGNVGSGEVKELADWAQYVNFSGSSPMSDLRRQNGRDKPWKVTYWGIGNEAWGCGGNMTAEYYADEYKKYATFMSAWGNEKGLFRIASGANGNDYEWTETLMKKIPRKLVEGLALHYYTVIDWEVKGPATNFTEEQYFKTMKSSWYMNEQVEKHAAIMDKYDPKKEIALVVDEWGAWYDSEPGSPDGVLNQQNTMRDALIAGMNLNIFNNHADRVRMANLAQAVNVLQSVILTKGDKMILTPTYYVLQMYKVHQDATLIPLKIKTDLYTFGAESLPAVTASASKASNGVVHLSLVNIDPKKHQEVTVDLGKGKFTKATASILTSNKVTDFNSFENPGIVNPKTFNVSKVKNGQISLKLPPYSVVQVEIN